MAACVIITLIKNLYLQVYSSIRIVQQELSYLLPMVSLHTLNTAHKMFNKQLLTAD